MSSDEDNEGKMKVVFAPGSFDGFEGTQEELDALVAEIMGMLESGDLLEKAVVLDEASFDELPDDVKESIMRDLANIDEDGDIDVKPRLLN